MAEKKMLKNGLAEARPFLFNRRDMNKLLIAAQKYSNLLNYEYHILLGRKGKSRLLLLTFSDSEFYHLAGLQYLTDLPALMKETSRSTVFTKILSGEINEDIIKDSSFYSKIEKRIELLAYLEDMLDSDNMYFHYNENVNPLSRIEAEYLFSDDIKQQLVFLFVDCDEGEKCFCRSFFPYDDYDYRQKQSKFTLLSKEKIDLRTSKSELQYTLHSPTIVYRRYSDEVLYRIICNLLLES